MKLIIKVDVDTDRGTKEGVPALKNLFLRKGIPATFLFSLGPDNTGKSIKRIFKPGFFKKIFRTKVGSNYGIKTLLYGTLLPPPHIGQRHYETMQGVAKKGFSVGIHTYDHFEWQNYMRTWSLRDTVNNFKKSYDTFLKIFNRPAKVAGTPGWQTNKNSLKAYESTKVFIGSDCRGRGPFFPKIGNYTSSVLQIPTTMPTLDELIGTKDFNEKRAAERYLDYLIHDINVITVHAELEGMRYIKFLEKFIDFTLMKNFKFFDLEQVGNKILVYHKNGKIEVPVCGIKQAFFPGRSGLLAVQDEI